MPAFHFQSDPHCGHCQWICAVLFRRMCRQWSLSQERQVRQVKQFEHRAERRGCLAMEILPINNQWQPASLMPLGYSDCAAVLNPHRVGLYGIDRASLMDR
jgi:hypothetical protein